MTALIIVGVVLYVLFVAALLVLAGTNRRAEEAATANDANRLVVDVETWLQAQP